MTLIDAKILLPIILKPMPAWAKRKYRSLIESVLEEWETAELFVDYEKINQCRLFIKDRYRVWQDYDINNLPCPVKRMEKESPQEWINRMYQQGDFSCGIIQLD